MFTEAFIFKNVYYPVFNTVINIRSMKTFHLSNPTYLPLGSRKKKALRNKYRYGLHNIRIIGERESPIPQYLTLYVHVLRRIAQFLLLYNAVQMLQNYERLRKETDRDIRCIIKDYNKNKRKGFRQCGKITQSPKFYCDCKKINFAGTKRPIIAARGSSEDGPDKARERTANTSAIQRYNDTVCK